MNVQEIVNNRYGKGIAQCSNEEIYYALLEMTKSMAKEKESNEGKRKLYYISAEFLIGKLLSNNLINLGIYEEVKQVLAENGKNLAEIEEVEPEPSLGNGGLGRLAACFLDSIATLGLNGDGVGLNYHYGLFKQVFEHNLQHEEPNPWIEKESWLTKTNVTYPVQFGGFTLQSRLYDIDVIGYENRTTKLHLFDVETVDESLVGDGINFDKEDIAKNLTLFLYPDDSDDKGRILRVYQQYFMVSNAAQLIIDETLARGGDLHKLDEYAAIQINDTHPSMVIPELIRLLMQRGILMDEAIEIVSKTCAYTNHTILAEALEKWPIHFLEKAVPQLLPIIYELNSRVVRKYDDKSVAIIDDEKRVHMAHMDIHYGYSVNGVAYLHTEILKNTELNNFYKIYPEKFNNKTNGVSHRRFLLQSNPGLSRYIAERVGDGWVEQPEKLEGLLAYADDTESLRELAKVKLAAKKNLCDYIARDFGIACNPDGVIDVQVKRIHAYKRQLLNAFKILALYDRLKDDPYAKVPASKAAHSYAFAKESIRFVCAVADLVNADPVVSRRMKVVFMENFGVTMGQRIYPAADISEQISTAGKEASGTGCMKFMMNGAVTLGTLDGANVEILERVGAENISIFGLTSEETERFTTQGGYNARECAESDPVLARVLAHLTDGSLGSKFWDLEDALLKYNDEFFVLRDFAPYLAAWDALAGETGNLSFQRKALVNIAKSGWFSSDRAVAEYVSDIWKIR